MWEGRCWGQEVLRGRGSRRRSSEGTEDTGQDHHAPRRCSGRPEHRRRTETRRHGGWVGRHPRRRTQAGPTALRAVKATQESRTRTLLMPKRLCSQFQCGLERRPKPASGHPCSLVGAEIVENPEKKRRLRALRPSREPGPLPAPPETGSQRVIKVSHYSFLSCSHTPPCLSVSVLRRCSGRPEQRRGAW